MEKTFISMPCLLFAPIYRIMQLAAFCCTNCIQMEVYKPMMYYTCNNIFEVTMLISTVSVSLQKPKVKQLGMTVNCACEIFVVFQLLYISPFLWEHVTGYTFPKNVCI